MSQLSTWRPSYNPWLIALTVSMATFMEVLDTSIANVSLPHIAGSLSAGQDESTWVLTSYLVANAIVLPLSAWLSDLVGRKRFYMTCVALFTISSFLCGTANSLGLLVFYRVLQGLGGGGLAPSEQAILADTFTPSQRGQAFALYGLAVVLAPAIGPTLGGWITDNYSWRWIFLINVPVGIASLLLCSRLVEDPPHARKKPGIFAQADYTGIALVGLGLGCLQVVLDKGQREDWFESRFIVGFTVVAIVAIAVFIWWELRTEHAVVNLRIFKSLNFVTSNVMMFVLGFALYSSTLLLPLFLQTLMGYTAQTSGEALTPGGLALLCLMPVIGFLTTKVQARVLAAIGFTVMSLSLFHMTVFNLDIDFKTAMVARIFQSLSLGFLFVPINTAAFSGLRPEQSNQVSSLMNLSRNLGASFGISIVTTYLERQTQAHRVFLVEHLSLFNDQYRVAVKGLEHWTGHGSLAAVATLQGLMERQARMLAFLDNFWFLAIATAVMVPLAFLMKKNRPGKDSLAAH